MYMVKFKGKFSEGQDKKLATTCFIKCCIKDQKIKNYLKKIYTITVTAIWNKQVSKTAWLFRTISVKTTKILAEGSSDKVPYQLKININLSKYQSKYINFKITVKKTNRIAKRRELISKLVEGVPPSSPSMRRTSISTCLSLRGLAI